MRGSCCGAHAGLMLNRELRLAAGTQEPHKSRLQSECHSQYAATTSLVTFCCHLTQLMQQGSEPSWWLLLSLLQVQVMLTP